MFLTFLLLLLLTKVDGQSDTQQIFIGILREPEQDDTRQIFLNILQNIERHFKNVKIKDYDVRLDRDYQNDSFNLICEMLSKGINIIIDLTWTPWNDIVDLITNANIPYIQIDSSIRPFISAMTQYIEAKNATDAAFIFQNQKEVLQGYHYLMSGSYLRTIIYEGINRKVSDRIKQIRPIPQQFSVIATTDNMHQTFTEMERYNLLTLPDRINLMFLDFKTQNFKPQTKYPQISTIIPNIEMCCKYTFGECLCSDMKIEPTVLNETVYILIETILSVGIQTEQTDCSKIENSPRDIATVNEFYQKITNSLAPHPFLILNTNKITYDVNLTVYTQKTGTFNEFVEIANIDNNNLLPISEQPINTTRRFFRIGVTEGPPWSFLKRDQRTGQLILDNNNNPIWEGYCIDTIVRLSIDLDFDYELVPPKAGTFGKKISDQKWDGLIGDLMIGDTDMAIAPLLMTAEREEVIDFVAPYFEETGILIVMRQPVRQTSLFKFMTVLRLEVWMSIIVALFATSILIWLLEVYSPYSGRNNKEAYPHNVKEFTLKESFWFALTSFTPQGGGEAPKAISGRIVVGAYWLFVVLMLATFTANLAAFLTVERMQTPVQSLEQLARQSRINYSVVENSLAHKYFENMKFAEDTLYRMWKEVALNSTFDQAKYRIWDYPIKEQYGHILLAIEAAGLVSDSNSGFRQVNENEDADFAFIHDASEIRYEISKNCNLTEVGEVFAEQPYAVAIQQGSSLRDELGQAILTLQKKQFFEELNAKFWNHSVKGVCPDTGESEGISLESLGGVFIATLFGLAISVLVLGIEIVSYRRRGSSTKTMTVEPFDNKNDDNVIIGSKSSSPKPNSIFRTNTKIHDINSDLDVTHISVIPDNFHN